MSLKHFHLFLIACASLFALGFAWLGLSGGSDVPISTPLAIISGVLGLALVAYGFIFWKKSKRII